MSIRWLDHTRRDVRHAWRMIARMPGLASVVIVSLAIGIGVNTAIFSWIQALVLKPLPGVQDAASFQLLEPRTEIGSHPGASWLEYKDLREQLPSFRDLLAFKMTPLNIGETGRTERTFGLLVSGNYFRVLGLDPALGRFFTPDEATQAGSAAVAVISDGFWHTRFAGVANPVGRTIRVNDRELTVVGVAPPRFQGTVTGMDWVNPHAWIHLDVKNADGTVTPWDIETGTPNTLFRRGFTKDSLKAGTEIVVEGYRAKNGKTRANGRDLMLPSGKRLFLGSSGTGAPYENELKDAEKK